MFRRAMKKFEKFLDDNSVQKMSINQIGYIVDWVIWFDMSGRAWVYADALVTPEPMGTSSFIIERTPVGYSLELPSHWYFPLDAYQPHRPSQLIYALRTTEEKDDG